MEDRSTSGRAMALAAALALGGSVIAEVVTLKSGQVLSGSIKSEGASLLTINRHGQDIAIKKEDIDSIDREDTSYYDEAYQKAVAQEDKQRVRRLLEAMKVHPEGAVRARGWELERVFESGGKEPDWPTGVDLEKATLEELHRRFHRAIDRVRWEEAREIGREVLRRHTPPVEFYGLLLEAHKQAKHETAYLLLDAERLHHHAGAEGSQAGQMYLATALEDRILKLWNEQRPERTDAEIHACLLARGMVLHSQAIHGAPEERRAEVERILRDMTTTEDWDYATRRVPGDLELLMFNGASRMKPELVPVVRYFSLLKEREILSARTNDPLLEGPMSEARAAYIYTVSEVIPLPKEKLWSSARDLALVRQQKPPKVSDIVQEVFDYTPAKKHAELAMAYEGLLVDEALTNRDHGEGLRRAIGMIVKRRCGAEIDESRTWLALRALATLAKGAARPGQPVEVSVSEVMSAAFEAISAFEKEKVCLLYEPLLLRTAEGGERGEGLLEAVRTAAGRRAVDSSTPREKWDCFRGLALLRGAGTGEPTVSEVLEAAFSVASPEYQPRVSLSFEDRVVEAAAVERGAALQQAIRQVAVHRGQDMTDAGASWRAFEALARAQGAVRDGGAAPAVSQVFDAAYSVVPARSHGALAVLFEDTIGETVRLGEDKGSGLLRAVESLSRARLEDPFAEPMAVWRATESHARFLFGNTASADDVLSLLEERSRASADLRINAMNVAAAYYTANAVGPLYVGFRERCARGVAEAVDRWIAGTAFMSGGLPVSTRAAPTVVAQSDVLREALQRQASHRNYLESLDDFERRLRERHRPPHDAVPDDALPALVQSLNDYWSGTTSQAARKRIMKTIEELFDEPARVRLLNAGLRLETAPAAEAAAR